MTSPAKKVVLHTHVAYGPSHEPLLQSLLDRGVEVLCVVGVDCARWEDAMDWLCIGPDGESRGFVLTSCHPDESLAEVVEFAKLCNQDGPSAIEILEVPPRPRGAEQPPGVMCLEEDRVVGTRSRDLVAEPVAPFADKVQGNTSTKAGGGRQVVGPVKVTGTWLGAYLYGAGYAALNGLEVPFTISLRESWLGRFAGCVRDDAQRGGVPEQGTVRGKRRRRRVEFRKAMPKHYVSEHGRLVDIHEWFLREFGATLPASLPPHFIDYTGELADDGLTMAGQWRIVPWIVRTDIGPYECGIGSGFWKAKRVSMQVQTRLPSTTGVAP